MPVVKVADAQVHYAVSGSGTGPALLLVHGVGSVGAPVTWGSTAPLLDGDRVVIAVDLSGTDATVDDGGELTVEILTGQVIAVIEDADLGPVDLLGFSMGAAVVAAVAALRPDLVHRLILVAGWAYTEGDEYLRNTFALWRRLGDTDAESFSRFVTMTGFARGFLNSIGRDAVEAMTHNMTPTPGTLRHVDFAVALDIRPLLPLIRTRTLVVGCARDATIPVEHSRALHDAIAGGSYVEIDAGHVVMFEKQDEFVARVREFIAAG
ncbi:alpha/beta fold hydrolase [Embleya hyalina]|uniref:Alpha/beta hydrolase n=1 Tax=Embleya hyalina TaxID=516124 RepID=A0A401YR99_9ACTN|nr:alpha/beta hydrolase [Embleya hyalina]GCD97134.1 alpha/beta hydrolase [Embleya hyalina]